MKTEFYTRILENPIIAAVTDMEKLKDARSSPCEIIFLLAGNVFNIREAVNSIRQVNKLVYVHLDLLEGLSKDNTAVDYLYKSITPDGIITTKSNLIKHAKEIGMFTIQRLFLLDSLAVESGIKTVNNCKPDAVEIMPGIMNKVTAKISKELKIPVIAGGLINEKEDVISCLNAGAMGISASNEDVWYM